MRQGLAAQVSGLHGTKDGYYSRNTDIDNLLHDIDLEKVDEYIYDPQEIWETDFLDEDLKQPSSSKVIKDPSSADMFNPTRIIHPSGPDWWPMDHITSFIKF
ncbi:hypothetical protein NDU88_006869 [Pleurodeles waltl]|uniref:Uncharacterized protein n=1 Tax=Pleurodeles waltl TaxID=8319 RepID=A0AAV7LQE5_PLEWA|nr:hypothetical protein NDU88_006869 [Pleurodeles waltl]